MVIRMSFNEWRKGSAAAADASGPAPTLEVAGIWLPSNGLERTAIRGKGRRLPVPQDMSSFFAGRPSTDVNDMSKRAA